jgi:hypothetical protein
MRNVSYGGNVLTVSPHEAEENVSLFCSLEYVEVLFPCMISNEAEVKTQCVIPGMLSLLCFESNRSLQEGTTGHMKGVGGGQQGISMDPRMSTLSRILRT